MAKRKPAQSSRKPGKKACANTKCGASLGARTKTCPHCGAEQPNKARGLSRKPSRGRLLEQLKARVAEINETLGSLETLRKEQKQLNDLIDTMES